MTYDGLIIKSLSGFYYVKYENGTVECRARGRFRNENLTPLTGDKVSISLVSDSSGVIENIYERKNTFIRPPVANIDMLVIIVSEAVPVTEPYLIDKMLSTAHVAGNCECVICINKCDEAPGDNLFKIYSSAGYKTIKVSALDGSGIEEIKQITAGKICAFTGNSGVGKSSILNKIDSGLSLETGDISKKLGRGRHTTRHTELFKLSNGAIVADTPGFSAFETPRPDLLVGEYLAVAFPDFSPFLGKCAFDDCRHKKEPNCAVAEAVSRGLIQKSRYESYLKTLEAAEKVKQWEVDKMSRG